MNINGGGREGGAIDFSLIQFDLESFFPNESIDFRLNISFFLRRKKEILR